MIEWATTMLYLLTIWMGFMTLALKTAAVCEENTKIGEARKTSKFSDKSEVYEVFCSNQKTPHSLTGSFLPLSGKYFIRGSGERAQILTSPLPLHLLVCTGFSQCAHDSLPGLT